MKDKLPLLSTLLFGAFLLINNLLFSQELDLKSYLDLVKKSNIDLKLSANQVLVSKQETKIARSALLPDVSINGFYQRDFNRNFLFINDFDGGLTRLRTNFNNSVNANAVLNQTLFDLSVFSAIKVVKLTEEISKLNDSHLTNEISTQASSLYWQAIFTKESIKVLVENSSLAKDQLAQIKKLHEKGLASDLQLQQAEVFYKKTLPTLKNAENQFKKLLNDLKILADIPLIEDIVLTEDLESIKLNGLINSSESDLETQPQLQVLKKEVEIANKQISIDKKFWYPKLNLAATYNYGAQANNFNFNDNSNKLFFLQLGVSMPIFSGGRNRAKISKAVIEEETARFNLAKTRQNLLNQLQTAENNYNNAIANIQTHKETILLNENEIEIFKKQLSLGVVTTIEFKESRLRLTQSKQELLNAYLDLHIAQLQIIRITGQKN
ncbi:TolC family protein [Leptobacterium flavescens]|uniref:TolC family protein n=1 Tax=Leptobacterium flavescens TaxID=472055 RepID=A0A6P0UQS9_9FLAO|nr:TolC family protein [Leptobacterium flavescens]NER14882.1 TolC family protein [Leptobacterium flavescens]